MVTWELSHTLDNNTRLPGAGIPDASSHNCKRVLAQQASANVDCLLQGLPFQRTLGAVITEEKGERTLGPEEVTIVPATSLPVT
ncbi:hypothetical protein BgiMline_019270 [Biomphalaria glabrata]|nr:hypothetical protein BgiMline_032141 [Biomphalaria glabrata]KAI8738741.1 hypothetical protein BgiBS90_035655 [Biomphalaria glabrata]